MQVHNGTLSLFTTADVATHYPVNVVVGAPSCCMADMS